MKYFYVLAFVLAIVGLTHYVDSLYYGHKIDVLGKQDMQLEDNLGVDFSAAIGLTFPRQIDCTQFLNKTNVSYCQGIDSERAGAQ